MSLKESNIKNTNNTVKLYLDKLSEINKETNSDLNKHYLPHVMTLCDWHIIFRVQTHSRKPLFLSYRLREWTRKNMYHQPTKTNEPNNENIIMTQKKPNSEDIKLQTAPNKGPTIYPSFSAVNY